MEGVSGVGGIADIERTSESPEGIGGIDLESDAQIVVPCLEVGACVLEPEFFFVSSRPKCKESAQGAPCVWRGRLAKDLAQHREKVLRLNCIQRQAPCVFEEGRSRIVLVHQRNLIERVSGVRCEGRQESSLFVGCLDREIELFQRKSVRVVGACDLCDGCGRARKDCARGSGR